MKRLLAALLAICLLAGCAFAEGEEGQPPAQPPVEAPQQETPPKQEPPKETPDFLGVLRIAAARFFRYDRGKCLRNREQHELPRGTCCSFFRERRV